MALENHRRKNTTVKYIDPASGWMYGFPKPAPEGFDQMTPDEVTEWFVSQGLPVELTLLPYRILE